MTGKRKVERLLHEFPNEVEYHRSDDYVVTCPTELYLVPTPIEVVIRILRKLELTPEDRVVDLGCGDGRFVISAAYLYGCEGVGVDVREDVLELARTKSETLGVDDKTTFIHTDVRDVDLRELDPDVVFVYLMPSLLDEISEELVSCEATIVSYTFEVPGLGAPEVLRLDDLRRAYVYRGVSH
ncbi:SAM-dependent methyltransferase [Methanopyrus sp.]